MAFFVVVVCHILHNVSFNSHRIKLDEKKKNEQETQKNEKSTHTHKLTTTTTHTLGLENRQNRITIQLTNVEFS